MKTIKFIPRLIKEQAFLAPKKSVVPKWWRDGEKEISVHGEASAGMRACIPFMEVMSIGYCIVTPFDIYVTETEEGNVSIRWNGTDSFNEFVGERPIELGSTIPRPAGHYPNGFVWASVWGWKTPKGYGSLVTHPLNRHDLPFTTLNAYVDSDAFNANGNIPFFIKQGFNGVIPAGTPFAQIIPVKRDKWFMWVDDGVLNKTQAQGAEVRNPETSYKKKYWKKFMGDFK